MARYLVSLIVEVDDAEVYVNNLLTNDSNISYSLTAYTGDELLIDTDSGTILNPEKCVIVPGRLFNNDLEYSDSEAMEIADAWGAPIVPPV